MRTVIHINLRPYRRASNAKFKLMFASIISALADSLHFPSPSPSLSELRMSLDKFSGLSAAVEAKDFSLKADRDLVRSFMLTQLQVLFAYCKFTAMQSSSSFDEAVAKIEGASLTVARTGGAFKGKPLPAPEGIRTKSLSQAVQIQWAAVKKARGYVIMKKEGLPSEPSAWTPTFTTSVSHTFTDIPPARIITCYVYALGAAGNGQPSGLISAIAGL